MNCRTVCLYLNIATVPAERFQKRDNVRLYKRLAARYGNVANAAFLHLSGLLKLSANTVLSGNARFISVPFSGS